MEVLSEESQTNSFPGSLSVGLESDLVGYHVQKSPADTATYENGSTFSPLVTLKDEYDQTYHIGQDDGCYVLYAERDGKCSWATHWFREAADALVELLTIRCRVA